GGVLRSHRDAENAWKRPFWWEAARRPGPYRPAAVGRRSAKFTGGGMLGRRATGWTAPRARAADEAAGAAPEGAGATRAERIPASGVAGIGRGDNCPGGGASRGRLCGATPSVGTGCASASAGGWPSATYIANCDSL